MRGRYFLLTLFLCLFCQAIISKNAADKAAKVIYDRGKHTLVVSMICFPLPGPSLAKDTARIHQEAMLVYNRIQNGEDFDTVGVEIVNAIHELLKCSHEEGEEHTHNPHELPEGFIDIYYMSIPDFSPLKYANVLEETVYAMNVGDVSRPIRSSNAFYLLKVHNRKTVENRPSFKAEKESILAAMATKPDRKSALYNTFSKQDKKKLGYEFFPEVYNELKELSKIYPANTNEFSNKTRLMKETMIRVGDYTYSPREFVYYTTVNRQHSDNLYSEDFLEDMLNAYIHDILTGVKKEQLQKQNQ